MSVLPKFSEKLHLLYGLSLPLLLFLIFLYKWLFINHGTRKNLPPSPPKLPIIGNLHQLGKFPHRSLLSLSKRYGKIISLKFGSRPTVVVSTASAAREIMKNQDVIFSNRPTLRFISRVFYDGRDIGFSPYGEYWRNIKSIAVLQLLSNKKVESFRSIREEEAVVLVEKIKSYGSSPLNLSELILTVTNDVVSRATLGRKHTGEDGDTDFDKLFKEFVEVLGAISLGDFIPWLGCWIDRLTGLEGRVEKVKRDFDEFLQKVVQEHQDRRNTKEYMDDEADKKVKDFVDVLLDVQKENQTGLPVDSIKALLLDTFGAGTETTFAVLEWAMTELIRHPRVMKELQDEVRGITKGKTRVSEDDLEDMKYLKAVIKETLRLHPPLPMLLFREPSEDVKIGGYDVAAKTQVIVNAWAIQRDPEFWEEAEEFRPERFINSSIDYRGQNFHYMPFGAGRRGCPGASYAIVSAEVVLASLVHEFNWKLPSGVEGATLDVAESVGITIRRKHPLVLIATPAPCL